MPLKLATQGTPAVTAAEPQTREETHRLMQFTDALRDRIIHSEADYQNEEEARVEELRSFHKPTTEAVGNLAKQNTDMKKLTNKVLAQMQEAFQGMNVSMADLTKAVKKDVPVYASRVGSEGSLDDIASEIAEKITQSPGSETVQAIQAHRSASDVTAQYLPTEMPSTVATSESAPEILKGTWKKLMNSIDASNSGSKKRKELKATLKNSIDSTPQEIINKIIESDKDLINKIKQSLKGTDVIPKLQTSPKSQKRTREGKSGDTPEGHRAQSAPSGIVEGSGMMIDGGALEHGVLRVMRNGKQVFRRSNLSRGLEGLLFRKSNVNPTKKDVADFERLTKIHADIIPRRAPNKTRATAVPAPVVRVQSADELFERLGTLLGEMKAGNKSLQAKNEISAIADTLLKNKQISKAEHTHLHSFL